MRVVVVEDEAIVARRVVRMVREILGDRLERIEHRPTLASARELVDESPIDLLLLDLNLHGEDGFDLLADSAADAHQTIVISARHDQALRAFEFGVTDFVPKPFDEARLRQALDRVDKRDEALRSRLRYLAVRNGAEIVSIAVDRIRYVQAADDYSEIHCDDGSTHLHAKGLTVLAQLLPSCFLRVHRSYIVNLERVTAHRTHGGGRYDVRLDDGTELPVSRTRLRRLRESMGTL